MEYYIYTVISVYLSRKEKSKEVKNKFTERITKKPLKIQLAIFFVIAGLALLIFGANLFVEGAVAIAKIFGISQAVIGLTVVALGTSLPELVTAAVASLKNEADIAIGNVVGSNVYNILLILGITAIIIPISASGITMVDLGVMIITAVIILPLSRTGFIMNRWEGALLLAGYIGYMYYLLPK